uniref:Odorant receptor n=1 Tax=Meteorus pulchricornis TaxID=51522 RepID=A0A1S5VFN9_9HYME|nr:olfactory receptor 45 [Meteorus pulchricornis]
MFEVKPEWAFIFTRFSVALVCAWPPNKNANKREMIIFDIKWWISWINSWLLSIPLAYAAYNDRQDILLFTKSLCLTACCIKCTIQMFICKIFQKRMQFVLDEMESYVRDAAPAEREIFLHYTKSRGIIHVIYLSYALSTSMGVIMGPLILPQPLPSDAKYPFRVDKHPLFDIIYIQQSIVGIQITSMGGIDCQMALMLWYIIVRLKVLQTEIRNIKNANEFSICIQKHQYLLWLAKEMIFIARYILLTTVIMATLSIILGGVHIVGNQPLIIRIQFTLIVFGFSLLLLLNAWPSEILIRSCQGIGMAMYESAWAKSNFDKKVVLVIQRSYKPVTIEVTGLLPKLSLNYYATFLSKAFSFFTTLRIVLSKMETNFPTAQV